MDENGRWVVFESPKQTKLKFFILWGLCFVGRNFAYGDGFKGYFLTIIVKE